MLSYRHAFHAGNFADVLKHTVLIKTIKYLLKKEAPLLYVDTHSGAGQYDLTSQMQEKTQEIKDGVKKFDLDILSKILTDYCDSIEADISNGHYPGSPKIAANLLRKKDLLQLYELHPTDYSVLQGLFTLNKNVRVSQSDGYSGLKALLPSKGRRAIVLIDPSYEIKSEYHQVIKELSAAYKRMPHAVFLLWYPIVDRQVSEKVLSRISHSTIKDALSLEFGIKEDQEGFGMTSSGMLVINPPWTLEEDMRTSLKGMTELWGSGSHFSIRRIKEE